MSALQETLVFTELLIVGIGLVAIGSRVVETRYRLGMFVLVSGAIIALSGVAVGMWPITFGGRCAKAFPHDGLAQERCIRRLSKGLEP